MQLELPLEWTGSSCHSSGRVWSRLPCPDVGFQEGLISKLQLGMKLVIKKAFGGGRNSMETETREIQIAFPLMYMLIGFVLTDIKGKLLQEFFETSALGIRTLKILSHQRNHLQVFPKALLGWRAPSMSPMPPSTYKHYLGRLEGVEMFIFFFFCSLKKKQHYCKHF